MIQLTPQHSIFILIDPIYFRKGIDGMVTVCKNLLHADPYLGDVFAFTNRARIFVHLLVYDGNGFWPCHKNSSTGRLQWWQATQH